MSLKADGYGIHEREGAAIIQLVPTTLLADDDLVAEDEHETTSLVLEARPRGQLVYLHDDRTIDEPALRHCKSLSE